MVLIGFPPSPLSIIRYVVRVVMNSCGDTGCWLKNRRTDVVVFTPYVALISVLRTDYAFGCHNTMYGLYKIRTCVVQYDSVRASKRMTAAKQLTL